MSALTTAPAGRGKLLLEVVPLAAGKRVGTGIAVSRVFPVQAWSVALEQVAFTQVFILCWARRDASMLCLPEGRKVHQVHQSLLGLLVSSTSGPSYWHRA
jgi:hypothetical protein